MYKVFLALTVATLTACASQEVAPATTADSTAVVTDTVTVTAPVVDSTTK